MGETEPFLVPSLDEDGKCLGEACREVGVPPREFFVLGVLERGCGDCSLAPAVLFTSPNGVLLPELGAEP